MNVTIGDVNDFAPEFDALEATLSLPENTELRTPIYSAHARDHDSGANGRVRYRLLRNPDGVFGISARDGSLSLVKKVDYEKRRTYQLVIAATDTGNPPLSTNLTLHIDVQDFNDNAPEFERDEYQVSVKESLEVNSQFLQLTATDADTGNNARLTYKLVDPPGKLFGIFPNSGWLYLKGELDRETIDQYRLTIEVTDNGTPSKSARTRALVRVLDVNDHSPVFSQETYEFAVTENMPAGTPVGSLAATDRDLGANASLRYTLNPTNGSFQVDPRTGQYPGWTEVLGQETGWLFALVCARGVKGGGGGEVRADSQSQCQSRSRKFLLMGYTHVCVHRPADLFAQTPMRPGLLPAMA